MHTNMQQNGKMEAISGNHARAHSWPSWVCTWFKNKWWSKMAE